MQQIVFIYKNKKILILYILQQFQNYNYIIYSKHHLTTVITNKQILLTASIFVYINHNQDETIRDLQ